MGHPIKLVLYLDGTGKESLFYTVMTKNSEFMSTNNHLTRQIKAKKLKFWWSRQPLSQLQSTPIPKQKKNSTACSPIRSLPVSRSAPNHRTFAWTEKKLKLLNPTLQPTASSPSPDNQSSSHRDSTTTGELQILFPATSRHRRQRSELSLVLSRDLSLSPVVLPSRPFGGFR